MKKLILILMLLFPVIAEAGLGSDVLSGWDFTSGWGEAGATITNATTFEVASTGGIYKGGLIPKGYTYRMTISGTRTSNDIIIYDSTSGGEIIYSSSGSPFATTFDFTPSATSNGNLYIRTFGASTIVIATFTLRQVIPISPAITTPEESVYRNAK